MTAAGSVAFLVDVDNTLLDNDRVTEDLRQHLDRVFGAGCRARYFELLAQLSAELGYRDYLGALQRLRLERQHDVRLLELSPWLVDYPFANRLYPGALDVLARFRGWGPTVIVSDGDVVFQPRKIARSGIAEAVDGHVLIYLRKDQELEDIRQRYPAEHYVVVDDKLPLLTAFKSAWRRGVTTVWPRQGHYARDPRAMLDNPPADLTVERIGDLLAYDLSALLAAAHGSRRAAYDTPPPRQAAGGVPTREETMNPTQQLHDAGQSLWVDNITRGMLDRGTLQHFVDDLWVTGLTSNPTIFDLAISKSDEYDTDIRRRHAEGLSGEDLFFAVAIGDLQRAADIFRPVHERTAGVDGWVSLELSPLLAYDTARSIAAAKQLHARAARPNLYIKIPGTPEGLPAIEECIFAGVPINVTLLFSREHYLAAADAYMRGIERRIAAGLPPVVSSVASLFVSRWDRAVADKVPPELRNQLGIAVSKITYRAYRELLDSDRWQRLANAGARPQRLLWGSTSTKDPNARDVLYIEALAAPHTVNTMPDSTLLAFADHGKVGSLLPADGGDGEEVITRFGQLGIDYATLAADLQRQGADAFVESWQSLQQTITRKGEALVRSA